MQIIKIIADAIIVEDIRRHHLRMHFAGVIAKFKRIHAVDPKRLRKRQRARSFVDDDAFMGATGKETNSDEVSEKNAELHGDVSGPEFGDAFYAL